jgi:hypothetical protein
MNTKQLLMYFPRTWEFGSALSKLQNFGGGGGFQPLTPSVSHCETARYSGTSANQFTAKL